VPLADTARATLPKTSYCEFASPKPGSSCGWVVTTWYDSMNASWSSFQLARTTFATWTWV
jgi:hypothetical protein